jgi:hypothetical protein
MKHFTWKLLCLLCIALWTAAPLRAEVQIGLAVALTGPYAWSGG